MNIPFYVINLAKDTQRYSNVQSEFAREGITTYTRIDAVLGETLTSEHLAESVSKMCKYFCTKASIGCAMSHIKAWESIDARGGVIFEDDIVLEPDFKSRFEKVLVKVPSDYDLVFIGCSVGCDYNNSRGLSSLAVGLLAGSKEYRIVNEDIFVPSTPLALHAYVLSYKGAKKMVSLLKGKISTHVDLQLLLDGSDLKVYATRERLVYQDVSTNTSMNAQSYPVLLNYLYSKSVDTYRIPLSYKMSVTSFQVLGLKFNLNLVTVVILAKIFKEKFVIWFALYNVIECIYRPSNYKDIIVLSVVSWIVAGMPWVWGGMKHGVQRWGPRTPGLPQVR